MILDEWYDIFQHLEIPGLSNTDLVAALFSPITQNPQFAICCGGAKHHHTKDGDLARHVYEVEKLAFSYGDAADAETAVLTTAAIWHDYGKIFEYDKNLETSVWEANGMQKRFGHIFISAQTFQETAFNLGVEREFIKRVVHCILSHHGRREWGSPVEPYTKEALILHQADYYSATFGEFANV